MIRWAGSRWGRRLRLVYRSEGVELCTATHTRCRCTGATGRRSTRQTKARCARSRLGDRRSVKIWALTRWSQCLAAFVKFSTAGEGEFGARIPRERRSHAIASTDLTTARDLMRGVEQALHSRCPSPHRAALAPDGRPSSRRPRSAIAHGGSQQLRIGATYPCIEPHGHLDNTVLLHWRGGSHFLSS